MHAVEKPIKSRAPLTSALQECSAASGNIFAIDGMHGIHEDKVPHHSGVLYNPLPVLPAFCSNDLFVPVAAIETHTNPRFHTQSRTVVMDLDLTMVGDLSWFSDQDNIRKNLGFKKPPVDGDGHGVPGSTSEPIDTASHDDVVQMLRSGGMRPGLLAFLDRVRRLGCLVVVYTHSQGDWAAQIVSGICTLLGYQFYSALLARDTCFDIGPGSPHRFRKSLDVVASKLKELHLYYDGSSSMHMAKTSYLMIDDNFVIAEEDSLLRCPPYVFVPSVVMDVTEGWLTEDIIAANLQGGAWAPFNRLVQIMKEWGYWTPLEAMRREAWAHWRYIPPFMLYPDEVASGAAAGDMPPVVDHATALSRLDPNYLQRYLQAKANEGLCLTDTFYERVVANVHSPMQLDARYLHSQVCEKG